MPDDGLVPDAETIAFEVKGAAEVAGNVRHAMAEAMARLLAAWAAGVRGESLRALVASELRAAHWPAMGSRLGALAVEAVELGVERASRELTGSQLRALTAGLVGPELELPSIDRDTRARVREVLKVAQALKLDTKRDLYAVIGKLGSVGSRAEGAARWAANEGINAGTSATAEAVDLNLVWVPERDACLHCLGYAGWSIEPGGTFPPGLSFGDNPIIRVDLHHPPLHPGCRCQVKLYEGQPGEPEGGLSSLDPADRLAAEARRSVVYGWTAHASQAATLRAMTQLLDQGAGLPASVIKRARTLARQGKTQPRPR